MPDPMTDISGASALGSIVSGGKGASAQQKDANAAGQLYNQEGQAIQQLLGNYMSQGMPIIQNLANFGAMQQPEINQLTTQLGQSGQSTVKGIQSHLGGVANPNALIQSLFNQNAQSTRTGTVDMEGQLVGQQLSGLQSAISALTQPLGSSLSGLQNLGGAYSQQAQSLGNPLQSMFGQLASNPLLQGLSGGGGAGGFDIFGGASTMSPLSNGAVAPAPGALSLTNLGGYDPSTYTGGTT